MSNFITLCLSGKVLLDEIDDFIDEWHEGRSNMTLYDYLGLTKKEYALFVQDEAYLASIVTARKEHRPIESIIESQLAMAARSDNQAKSKKLEKWLKDEGLWE